MQNQGFHAVCKNDIPQPSKHLKIDIFGPKYAPKSHPKLLRISAFDFVTFWITFWLRLGSFLPPVWPRTNPFGPQRPSQWPPKAPRGPKGLPWRAPRGPKGSPRRPTMPFWLNFGWWFPGGSANFALNHGLPSTISNPHTTYYNPQSPYHQLQSTFAIRRYTKKAGAGGRQRSH